MADLTSDRPSSIRRVGWCARVFKSAPSNAVEDAASSTFGYRLKHSNNVGMLVMLSHVQTCHKSCMMGGSGRAAVDFRVAMNSFFIWMTDCSDRK